MTATDGDGPMKSCPACRTDNPADAESCEVCSYSFSTLGPGTLIGGRYEIVEVLGQGGMGVVYRARDRVLDEGVALKVLRPGFAETPEMARRFRSEIKLARRITHRNVCRIHEYGEDGRLRWISMELVDGVNLKRAVRSGALPEAEAYELTLQICKGLQAIHDVGVIHRDLKTANLMRDERGLVRVMDFGIAKEWGREHPDELTSAGAIIGTPEYMSPEQAHGQALDFRSDIYSLGVIVFELYTGDLPFRGDSPLNTLVRHVLDPPPLDGRVPPYVVPVLSKALAKSAEDRYATARGLAAELRQARAQASPTEVVTGPRRSTVAFRWQQLTQPVDATAEAEDDAVGAAEAEADQVESLIQALKSPSETLRWKAALGLWKLGSGAGAALPALRDALADPAEAVVDAARTAIKRIGGDAALATPPPRSTPLSAPTPPTFAGPGDETPLPLEPVPPERAAFHATGVDAPTGELEPGGADVAAASEPAATEVPPAERPPEVVEPSEHGPAAAPEQPEAVPAEPPAAVPGMAGAEATTPAPESAIAAPAPEILATALEALQRMLQDEDPALRWRAVLALGEMGPSAREAVPLLIEALDDLDDNVRWTVAATLGKLGPVAAEAVRALAAALSDDGDDVLRRHAAAALGRIGPAASQAVPGLIAAFRSRAHEVRDQVAEALVQIGPASVPALMEALTDDDERVRFAAAEALTLISTTHLRPPASA